MDLSDGLATDLRRLCAESRVGATITLDAIPIASSTRQIAAALEQDPLAWATGGGEDYELLVVVSADAFAAVSAGMARETRSTLTRVGVIESGDTVRFVDSRGREANVARGFEHFVTGR
jgi:thiamine-monophosphate kinase